MWSFPAACGQVRESSRASDTRLERCLFVRSVPFVKDSRCVEAPVRAPRLARVEVLEAPSSAARSRVADIEQAIDRTLRSTIHS
jgi:hypothetical protein